MPGANNDPRRFLVSNCDTDRNKIITNTEKKKGFLDEARFLGGVEGLGTIGEGLRQVVGVSDVIGNGGVVPLAFGGTGGSDEAGENGVMAAVGINPRQAKANVSLSPTVVNQGVAAARSVWDKAKQGNFKISDIKDVASDLKNLYQFGEQIFTPDDANSSTSESYCQASPYAMDLIKFAPTQKYMFVVQFDFNIEYQDYKDAFGKTFAFLVKQTDRPQIQFEYEDINMYNFKTKVIKKTIYNPISMRFIDDDKNNGLSFYNSYLKIMSPIANLDSSLRYEDGGLGFEGLGQRAARKVPTHEYSASVGPLLENNKSIIREIKVFHIVKNGHNMNVYHYFNPKITEMQMNELMMAESGEGGEITLNFAYDGLYIEQNVSLNKDASGIDITDITEVGDYPIRYAGPGPVESTEVESDDYFETTPPDNDDGFTLEELQLDRDGATIRK